MKVLSLSLTLRLCLMAPLPLALGACAEPVAPTAADATSVDSAAGEVDAAPKGCTSAAACNDDNPCTDDVCGKDGACQHPAQDGPCDDGNPCTGTGACKAGACAPGPAKVCDDANPCTADACGPAGACTVTAKDGPCDDANPCSAGDACAGGKCAPGAKSPCDDGDACTTDACAAPTGACSHSAVDSALCVAKAWPELLVRATAPAGDWQTATTTTVAFGGVALGLADSVTWTTGAGKSGTANLDTTNWQAEVPLAPGDNLVTFGAKRGPAHAEHAVRVVYATWPAFGGPPDVSPRVVQAGAAKLRVAIPVVVDDVAVVKGVRAFLVDATGGDPKQPLDLYDDGGPCDAQAQDGLWSACLQLQDAQPGPLYLRVRATLPPTLKEGEPTLTWSLPARVDVVPAWTMGDCEAQQALLSNATAKLQLLTKQKDAAQANAAVLADLKASPLVAQAGDAAPGAWVRFANGMLGLVQPHVAGTRGASSPYAAVARPELPDTVTDEALGLDGWFGQTPCKPLSPLNFSTTAPAEMARQLRHAGLFTAIGHGGRAFAGLVKATLQGYGWHHPGAQEYWSVQAPIDCSALPKLASAGGLGIAPSDKSCKPKEGQVSDALQCSPWLLGDLFAGRVALHGGDRMALLPSFFAHHTPNLAGAVVYLGLCSSASNGSLATELVGAGAAAVVGWSGTVTDGFASKTAAPWLLALATGAPAGQGLPFVDDPKYPGTRLRLVGDAKATVGVAALANAGFEAGGTGWILEGTARLARMLGPILPEVGKRMALLHTAGSDTQLQNPFSYPTRARTAVCVPPAGANLCLRWRYLSAEAAAGCDPADVFSLAVLKTGVGPQSELVVNAEGLCYPNTCSKCGGYSGPKQVAPVAIGPAEGSTAGQAGDSGWVKSCFDLGGWAGQRIELSLQLTSKPDHETAVVVDDLSGL